MRSRRHAEPGHRARPNPPRSRMIPGVPDGSRDPVPRTPRMARRRPTSRPGHQLPADAPDGGSRALEPAEPRPAPTRWSSNRMPRPAAHGAPVGGGPRRSRPVTWCCSTAAPGRRRRSRVVAGPPRNLGGALPRPLSLHGQSRRISSSRTPRSRSSWPALDIDALLDLADPATVAVRYGFKDVGTIIGVPAPNLAEPARGDVGVPTSYTPPSLPATAFLRDATGGGVLVTVTAAGTGQVTLTGRRNPPTAVTAPLPVPLQLLLDLVPVSRGKTVTGEVLGSGNAALANQSFTLAKSPLTYLASGNGPVAALAVYVDGVEWQRGAELLRPGRERPGVRGVAVAGPDRHHGDVRRRRQRGPAPVRDRQRRRHLPVRLGRGEPARRAADDDRPAAAQPGLHPEPGSRVRRRRPAGPEDVRADAPASVFTFGRAISADGLRGRRRAGSRRLPGRRLLDLRRGRAAHAGDCLRGRRPGGGRCGKRRARRIRRPEPAGHRGPARPPIELDA